MVLCDKEETPGAMGTYKEASNPDWKEKGTLHFLGRGNSMDKQRTAYFSVTQTVPQVRQGEQHREAGQVIRTQKDRGTHQEREDASSKEAMWEEKMGQE